MKATMNSKELRNALQLVKPDPANRILPVLSNAHLEFKNDMAVITATNMDTATQITIPAKSDTLFSCLLPIQTTNIFLTGANDKIVLEKSDKETTLTRPELGKCVFTDIPKIADFPPIHLSSNDLSWTSLDAKWLCQMLPIAITACAKEISRPILTGIVCTDGRIASADGFRLVSIKHDKLALGLGDKEVIIPAQTAKILCKLFPKTDSIQVAFKEDLSSAYFKSNDTLLIATLIQGSYPKYENLIPESYNCKVSFSSPLMLQRLALIDKIYSGITRLSFERDKTAKDEVCQISGSQVEEYSYSLNCPVKIDTGETGKIAFNLSYLRDALKPFSMVTLEITSLSSPGKLYGDIEGLTIVIMPMFVQW